LLLSKLGLRLLTSHAWLYLVISGSESEDLTLGDDDGVLKLCHLLKHAIEDGCNGVTREKEVDLMCSTTVQAWAHANLKGLFLLWERTWIENVPLFPFDIKDVVHLPASHEIHDLKARDLPSTFAALTSLKILIVNGGEGHVVRRYLVHGLFELIAKVW
jgi:hypothetical protein